MLKCNFFSKKHYIRWKYLLPICKIDKKQQGAQHLFTFIYICKAYAKNLTVHVEEVRQDLPHVEARILITKTRSFGQVF